MDRIVVNVATGEKTTVPLTPGEVAEVQARAEAAAAVIPDEVTALQGLLALETAGYATDYEAWAGSASRTFSERAFINKALVWRRTSDTIAAVCLALGISDTERDQLFVLAATLQP